MSIFSGEDQRSRTAPVFEVLGAQEQVRTEKLHLNDLPDSTIDCACDQIALFTVGLQRLWIKDGAEELTLIGTGTLVVVCERHCILTAEHVLAEIRPGDRLALMTSFSGKIRRHAFDQSHLQIFRIARGVEDEKGPDIGIVVLPETNIGTLLAEKSFFNIDKRRERFANGFIDREMGFWFTCGVVGESEEQLPKRPGFRQIKGYHALCGTSAKPAEYEREQFDYLEVRISYVPENPELPWSFGGFSGGGIWQVPMRKTVADQIEPEEFCLSGVVYYQTSIEGGIRRLLGHGRRTVYSCVLEFLQKELRS